MKNIVTLCVCTFKRPKFLQSCLSSIAKLDTLPEKNDFRLIVVDNENSEVIAAQVEKFKNRVSFPVIYKAEPQAGLVFARNAALEAAKAEKADYIGFIDDDETVTPDWLKDMFKSLKDTGADALAGPVEIIAPANASSAVISAYQFKKPKLYTPSATLPMGNVFFKAAILKNDLAFDPRFNKTGGEDVDFFRRAGKAGASLFRTPYGSVYETLTPEKATLKAYFKRQVRVARIHYREKYPRFTLGFIKEAALCPLECLAGTLLAPFALFSDKIAVKAVKLYAKAVGRIQSRSNAGLEYYGV